VAAEVHVEMIAPDRGPDKFDVEEITLPGAAGVFSVQPGHTPFITTLLPGVVEVFSGGEEVRHYAVHEGVAEVLEDHVRVLVEAFEPGDAIDLARAERARERAQKALKRTDETLELKRAEMALARAAARIHAHHGEGY